ncbi:MAG TPA: hypothetical protein VNF75_08220 [Candidatus Dormibacteraeota bacterium]|nr:hypothetical protein [Candidatus Dormibacteraeota bacterium]
MSPARGLRRRSLLAAAAVLIGGGLVSACAAPTAAPRLALQGFLADVQAHSVVYAYTLLTNAAETQTSFIPFFNGVKATKATFKVVAVRMVDSSAADATVAVTVPGQGTTYVHVQMLEEGNAGDWLVNAPFVNQGASAIRLFQ